MYNIELSGKAAKFLDRLDQKTYLRIYERLQLLRQNPFHTSLDVKKMKGVKDTFRLRVGSFRILYQIREKKLLIFVFDIDTRETVLVAPRGIQSPTRAAMRHHTSQSGSAKEAIRSAPMRCLPPGGKRRER